MISLLGDTNGLYDQLQATVQMNLQQVDLIITFDTAHPAYLSGPFLCDIKENTYLDRASPELWPEQSVSEFISTRQPDLNIQTPAKYTTDLDKEDLELIHDFGSLSTQQLMDKIKQLQNLAYQVGLEESKEMSRGKFLNILGKR
ncbi:Protein lin-52 [Sparganum proliferum]